MGREKFPFYHNRATTTRLETSTVAQKRTYAVTLQEFTIVAQVWTANVDRGNPPDGCHVHDLDCKCVCNCLENTVNHAARDYFHAKRTKPRNPLESELISWE